MCDKASGADDGSFADGDTRHDNAADSDMAVVFEYNFGGFERPVFGFDARRVAFHVAFVANDFNTVSDEHATSDFDEFGVVVVE